MLSQTLIEIGVGCRNKHRRTEITLHEIAEIGARLPDQRIMQKHILPTVADAFKILGKKIAIRRRGVDLAQVEPLSEKVSNEGLEAR